jgi:NAD(P)-dependent dehydrogenase (short-subunit alcohol dehydrogenase family)
MAIPDLRHRRVLVTGAGSGIGFATALAFARAGAHLLVVDVAAERLEKVAHEVRLLGAEAQAFVADVSNEDAMLAIAARIHDASGALDVLVNNAGVGFLGSFLETPPAAWQQILGINVLGVVNGCRAFLPKMLQSGRAGHIVNVASAAGLAPACNLSAYTASKHAVVGLSDCLSMELSTSRIAVTVVCPGIINTPIARPGAASVGRSITSQQLARLAAFYRDKGADPGVVADAIVDSVRTGRSLVLVGPFARLIFHLRRLSRALLMRVLIADSKRVGWI